MIVAEGGAATPDAAVLLQTVGVVKRWDATSGLDPVDLTLRAGELVALRGRSGSGKSTLLALLAGWCEPDSGRIVRSGGWGADDRWRAWSITALVPQVLGLFGELSASEHLDLVLRLGRSPRAGRDRMISGTLARLDLTELADRRPAEMSLGQQQRLAVARAVIAEPLLVLADEPTCHQDEVHARQVVTVLREVTRRGGAVLVAGHDDQLTRLADRVVTLDPPAA